MNAKIFHAGAAAALVWAGVARADDAQQTQMHDRQQTQMHDRQHDAVHEAMHEAMHRQMATPSATAQMPGLPDRAAADATAAHERAREMQQVREAARQRAMKHGAQDAAMARGDMPGRGGMQGGATMGGDASTSQQGAGMMRTGTMHGGSGGMMPGGGMGGGGGMMGASATSTSTGPTTGTMPGATGTGASSGGGSMTR